MLASNACVIVTCSIAITYSSVMCASCAVLPTAMLCLPVVSCRMLCKCLIFLAFLYAISVLPTAMLLIPVVLCYLEQCFMHQWYSHNLQQYYEYLLCCVTYSNVMCASCAANHCESLYQRQCYRYQWWWYSMRHNPSQARVFLLLRKCLTCSENMV